MAGPVGQMREVQKMLSNSRKIPYHLTDHVPIVMILGRLLTEYNGPL